MGRSILDSLPPEQWPHSLRSTRLKLLQVAKRLAKQPTSPSIVVSPALSSPRMTQRGGSRAPRVPFPRQNSMDYLPVVEEQPMSSTKYSTFHSPHSPALKISFYRKSPSHRSERVIAHAPFHPYERPLRLKTRSTPDPSLLSRTPPTHEKRKCKTSSITPNVFRPSSDSLSLQNEVHTSLAPAYLNIAITVSPSSSTSSLVSKRIPSYKNHPNYTIPDIEKKKRTRKRSGTKPGSPYPTGVTSERHRTTRKRPPHLDDENVFTPDMDDARSFSELSLGSSFVMDDSRPSSRRSRRLTPLSRCGTPLSIASSVEGEGRSPRRLRRSGRLSLYRVDDDEFFGNGVASGTRRMVGRKISFGSDSGYEAGMIVPMAESSNGKLVFGGLLQPPFEG